MPDHPLATGRVRDTATVGQVAALPTRPGDTSTMLWTLLGALLAVGGVLSLAYAKHRHSRLATS